MVKYAIFRTKWGFLGLVGGEFGVLRSRLPRVKYEEVQKDLLENLPDARYEKTLFAGLQQEIMAYYDGCNVAFDRSVNVVLDGFSDFGRDVLLACRDIRYGQTMSYGQLAAKAGYKGAARAVGKVMSCNPVPLIIPCHRVVRSDGGLGGFSGVGGIELKKKMLEHERNGRSC